MNHRAYLVIGIFLVITVVAAAPAWLSAAPEAPRNPVVQAQIVAEPTMTPEATSESVPVVSRPVATALSISMPPIPQPVIPAHYCGNSRDQYVSAAFPDLFVQAGSPRGTTWTAGGPCIEAPSLPLSHINPAPYRAQNTVYLSKACGAIALWSALMGMKQEQPDLTMVVPESPEELYRELLAVGEGNAGDPIYAAEIRTIAEGFGLGYQKIPSETVTFAAIKDALDAGGYVMVAFGPGIYADVGPAAPYRGGASHWIVLVGYAVDDTGEPVGLYANDSSSPWNSWEDGTEVSDNGRTLFIPFYVFRRFMVPGGGSAILLTPPSP